MGPVDVAREFVHSFCAEVCLQHLLNPTNMSEDTKLSILDATAWYVSKLRQVGMVLLQRTLQSNSYLTCNSFSIWTNNAYGPERCGMAKWLARFRHEVAEVGIEPGWSEEATSP